MLTQFETIQLYKGATSTVSIDLSRFEFGTGSVLLTIKNRKGNVVFSQSFTEAKIHSVLFSNDFTKTLEISDTEYTYDFMHVIGENRYPQCAVSSVNVKKVVGGID